MWAPFIRRVAGGEDEERAASPGDDISFEREELSDSSDDEADGGLLRGDGGGIGDGGGFVGDGFGGVADHFRAGLGGNVVSDEGGCQ